MSALLDRVLSLSQRAASRLHGGSIVYHRGSDSVSLEATFGRTEFQVETADVVKIEHTDRDFIFTASALVIGGVVVTPAKSDTVECGGETFEVLAPSGAQVYRSCDPAGYLIRVHTKRVT